MRLVSDNFEFFCHEGSRIDGLPYTKAYRTIFSINEYCSQIPHHLVLIFGYIPQHLELIAQRKMQDSSEW